MVELKPVPNPEIPHVSRAKLATLAVLVIGAIALGVTIQIRNQNKPSDILGEQTADLGTIASDELGKALLGKNGEILKKGSNPEKIIEESQSFLSSKAAEIGNRANMEVEKMSSQAAKNVTDFIYKNTIERVIDTLILSLPEERQKKFKF